MASPRGYGTLPWDHERSLEVEAELAAWLSHEFEGKIFWTGAGPAIRERFKLKFPINVFSTPDLAFIPEFYRDGGAVGWGEPFFFDVTERIEYAWRGSRFPTVYAQAEKVDALARIGGQTYLAYKWKDGVWTFCAVADIVALKLRPVMVGTVIGGVKSEQKNYKVPRGLWKEQDAFRALMLERIKNSKPLDYVGILRKIDDARETDMERLVSLLKTEIGEERLKRMAEYYLALKQMIVWNPERELEPSTYIFQRALESVLMGKRRRAGVSRPSRRRSRR
jgi:hypothetical protein